MSACLLHATEAGCARGSIGPGTVRSDHAYPCTPRVPEVRVTRAPRPGAEFADYIDPVPEMTVKLAGGGAFLIIDLVRGTIPLATEGAMKPEPVARARPRSLLREAVMPGGRPVEG